MVDYSTKKLEFLDIMIVFTW